MNNTTTQDAEHAEWQGDTLHYHAVYEWPQLHTEDMQFAKVNPIQEQFCYWVAVGGDCFAVAPIIGQTCIASIQKAIGLTDMPRNHGGWLDNGSVYVIWQPKDHSAAAWKRWQTKWSKRTALSQAD